jgi:hypothetical protein
MTLRGTAIGMNHDEVPAILFTVFLPIEGGKLKDS